MSKKAWPTVEDQIKASKAVRGGDVEKLIRENQDFHMLRHEEANDKIGLPPWLRVHWRKHHPEGVYSANDPTGGYPRVLQRLHSRMLQEERERSR